MHAPVSTKSSSVVEFVQKIEAAALWNNTASLWLYSLPSVPLQSHLVCISPTILSYKFSVKPVCFSSLAHTSAQTISAASWWERKSNSLLVLVYQGHWWLKWSVKLQHRKAFNMSSTLVFIFYLPIKKQPLGMCFLSTLLSYIAVHSF